MYILVKQSILIFLLILPISDSEIQLLKDVPLYNDVMLPSTSDKLALPLSPLPPSEPLLVTTHSEDAKSEGYAPAPSTSPANHSPPEVVGLLNYCHFAL